MTDASRPDADRLALLELLLDEAGLSSPGATSIPARDPSAAPVLSYAQERLWFLQQFETETASLSIRIAERLRGPLDHETLRRSLDAMIVRHSSLRTMISAVGGEPRPCVVDATRMPIAIDDLRTHHDPALRLDDILDEEARRTFDLERDLPIFIRLIVLADDDHVLSIVMHHVAADGWSLQIFFRDLGELYTSFTDERPAALPELPIEYADYAAWQRTWVAGDKLDRQLEYWKERLAGPLPVCEIPPDFVRPRIHTFNGGQVAGTVDSATASALRTLGVDHGATPFMVLLAAFDVVVARRAGQDDIIVGTPVAGRVRRELEDMVGMFLNTLVLRTDLEDDPAFTALVERVRDDCLSAFDHQDVPFERLLAELHPRRDISRTPLFQVFFNMLNFSIDAQDDLVPGLRHEVVAQPSVGSKFDLTMYVVDQDGTFELMLVYNAGLYRADTMRQLLDQYMSLLDSVAADPSRPVSTYPLVTEEATRVLPDELQMLDDTWHGSVPNAVRRIAERTPGHLAVVDDEAKWTYRDLETHMDRIATWLNARSVGAGDVVAIYGHRSASTVAAVTGVLAAGAAYTLLDPRYPGPRLAEYLRISHPAGWIEVAAAGTPPLDVIEELERLGVGARLSIPTLDELDAESIGEAPPDRPKTMAISDTIGPDDLACLTFTSGSTGVPKAVMGRHGSLTHFLPWQSERFDIDASDRFSMLSGLAHDPIQRDMFWPLWLGATVVVPDPDQIATPGWLVEWLRRERITVAHLTPAMGQLMAEGETVRRAIDPVHSLRRAFFIGDVLRAADVGRFQHRFPRATVVNLYGTTETQRASGHHVVDADVRPDAPRDHVDRAASLQRVVLPVGTGIPGAQLLIRDSNGRSCSFGEIGEIWVRSHHLALGYLGRPGDTAERFHEHSSGKRGDRCYRTGDRGRYLPNGEVEFLGRDDDQIQLRGHRVELGDIEATIAGDPHVRNAVVQLRTDRGSARLVAYVVPATAELDLQQLRSTLRARLPAHMVPVDYVVLSALPMTPNGKLDRSALPPPEDAPATAHSTEGQPRNELERRLVGWWEDVLGCSGIGTGDNFFDLGGYSLLATRLFAIIEANTGQRVPVSALFEAPTIAELADVLRGDDVPPPWSSLVPIQPNGSQVPFFYVAPYMISVLQFVHLGQELGVDQPFYGLQPQGLDGRLPIHSTIEEMAAHYISEIRAVQPHGPYRLGGHCSGTWVAFEMARQLESAGERIAILVLVDQGPPEAGGLVEQPWRYLYRRLRFYHRDKRLWPALAWQARIILNRILLRRVGSPTTRYTGEVRAVHRAAYRPYRGGMVDADILLVRSDESLAVNDKDWHLAWARKTTGEFRHARSAGSHDDLLEHPQVRMLADRVRWAFSLANTVGEGP